MRVYDLKFIITTMKSNQQQQREQYRPLSSPSSGDLVDEAGAGVDDISDYYSGDSGSDLTVTNRPLTDLLNIKSTCSEHPCHHRRSTSTYTIDPIQIRNDVLFCYL